MSTPRRPKQLLALASDRPLIRDTLDRARRLTDPDRIRILTGTRLVGPFREVLPALSDSAYMVEPQARGTAPALAWAAWSALRHDENAVMVSLHADHRVEPESAFTRLLTDAARIADDTGLLLTVGVPPTRPETGYGYIQPGAEIGRVDGTRARAVAAFHEKPDLGTAREYVAAGHLWNTGLFIWRADRFLEDVREHAPDIGAALAHLDRGDVAGYFDAAPSISVDHAVLERSENVAVVDATFDWDDVGSWTALARTRPSDPAGNVSVGPVHVAEARGNIVASDGDPVVLWGVDDLVVVRASGVTFVTTRDRAPDLKRLLPELPESVRNPDA
jgi:mannose-1-phosphate guanylyltransferase